MFCKFWLYQILSLLIFTSPVIAEVTEIDNETLKQLLADGVPLVDVRTASEWKETGIIEGSHLLTFFDESGNYDVNGWLQKLQQIVQPDQPVALICAIGGRTQAISHFLDAQAGYSKVYNVTTGIKAWIDAGNTTIPSAAQANSPK